MITLSAFRMLCATRSPEDIVDEVILRDDAVHVSAANRTYLLSSLSDTFGVEEGSVRIWIVGSAKLGFSITEKKRADQVYPRYRPFSPVSDIDIAVVSPEIFRIIWDEVSIYAYGQPWMPWNSGRLGDYLVYGWLRPDYFPKARVRRCDDWWDLFRRLSANPRFGRRAVRGGLFHSLDDLKRYLRRSVLECVRIEQGLA